MIELFSGTPGSGKSLHVAEVIYYYANARFNNRLVVTNFDVNKSKLRHPERVLCLTNEDLHTPDDVIQISKNFHSCIRPRAEDNILLVMDIHQ